MTAHEELKSNSTASSFDQRAKVVIMNLQVVIAFFGIIGSILTICVFRQKRLKNSSYSAYFRTIAVFDCIVVVHSFRHWARVILGYNIDLVSPILCKLNEYQPYVAANSQLWLLTVILADRLVTVVYHNQMTFFKKRWFQRLLVSTVLVYCSLVHLILPLNFELKLKKVVLSSYSLNYVMVCELPLKISQINSFLFFTNTVATMTVNCLLYIKLISFISKSRKKIAYRNSLVMVRDFKFAVSSIAYTMITLTCKIPIGIGLYLYNYFHGSRDHFELIFMICVTFAIISNGATFYVNFFFNSIFYEEFCKLFRFRRNSIRY